MNNEDMSDVIKNLSSMLDNANIPDNIKDMLNNFQNSSSSSNSNDSSNDDISSNNSSSESSGIDMETILKISSIISKMNNSKNDPRANLLLSLKPYLKESRQSKVDQYVKLLNMSKVLEVINPNDNSEKVK